MRMTAPAPPVLLFVDGACEPGFMGIGAVMIDRASGVQEAFGIRLPDSVVEALVKLAGTE